LCAMAIENVKMISFHFKEYILYYYVFLEHF
jgi:hypothetical protein